MEHQLETAKIEVEKPFAQEAELAEKLERLAALNALLNMDEKGDDAIGMDDESEKESGERETFDQQAEPADHSVMQNDRKAVQPESISEKPENAADAPIPYPGENAGWCLWRAAEVRR